MTDADQESHELCHALFLLIDKKILLYFSVSLRFLLKYN